MKIAFGTIALLTLIHFYSIAQPVIGVKAGFHINYLTASNGFSARKDYAGIHAGVFSEIRISNYFSFNPELRFSARKYHVNVFAYNIRMGYAEVPLVISWKPIEQLSLEAGPYAAFKLYAKSEGEFYPVTAFNKPVDAGLTAGLQLHFTKNLSFIARYSLGLIPLADIELRLETNQSIGHLEAYGRTFEASLGWRFRKL